MNTRKNVVVSLLVFVVLFSLTAVSVVADQVNEDNRINQAHHFGGDALYCVDANYDPTTDFDTMIFEGGLRLLNEEGQELWFIEGADIIDAMNASLASGNYEPIASGFGTYGPTEVSVLATPDGKVSFMMVGYDEHGKTNLIMWDFCLPVGVGNYGDSPDAIEGGKDDSSDPCTERGTIIDPCTE